MVEPRLQFSKIHIQLSSKNKHIAYKGLQGLHLLGLMSLVNNVSLANKLEDPCGPCDKHQNPHAHRTSFSNARRNFNPKGKGEKLVRMVIGS